MAAPTDLEDLGYGRGQLRAGPAASVRRLDVLLGRPLDINRAYADYATQLRYYLAYVAYVNGRGPWAPLALHPDKSWHCKGMAIDTDDRLGATWKEHGWLFEVKGEPWHGQYYTSLDKHYGETAGSGAKPFPIPEEQDDMITISGAGRPWAVIGGVPFGAQKIDNPADQQWAGDISSKVLTGLTTEKYDAYVRIATGGLHIDQIPTIGTEVWAHNVTGQVGALNAAAMLDRIYGIVQRLEAELP